MSLQKLVVDRPLATYLSFLLGAALWCSAIVMAPLLVASGGTLHAAGIFLYQFFHPICHQIDNRSLHLFGGPMATCSRCFAIYAAFLGGTVLYPLVRDLRAPMVPQRAFLIAALAPLVVDGLAGGGLVYEATLVSRVVTGSIAGAALSFTVIPAAIEASGQLFVQPQKGLRDA